MVWHTRLWHKDFIPSFNSPNTSWETQVYVQEKQALQPSKQVSANTKKKNTKTGTWPKYLR